MIKYKEYIIYFFHSSDIFYYDIQLGSLYYVIFINIALNIPAEHIIRQIIYKKIPIYGIIYRDLEFLNI